MAHPVTFKHITNFLIQSHDIIFGKAHPVRRVKQQNPLFTLGNNAVEIGF